MTHNHTPKTNRSIFEDTISECTCGARKWTSGRPISGGRLDVDGWYVVEDPETSEDHDYEMLQTEGYGYDGSDKNDPLDSHHPDFQD